MHHNLCVFCTFSAIAQNIFKGLGCNFTWSFGEVMRIKSLKMVFVARIIRHELCMIYAFFDFVVQKTFLTKNHFLTAEINLTMWGPLYTFLVVIQSIFSLTLKIGTKFTVFCHVYRPLDSMCIGLQLLYYFLDFSEKVPLFYVTQL